MGKIPTSWRNSLGDSLYTLQLVLSVIFVIEFGQGFWGSNWVFPYLQIDLQLRSSNQPIAADISREVICNKSCQSREIDQTPTMLPIVSVGNNHEVDFVVYPSTLTTDPCSEQKDIKTRQSLFELPDLNVPLEEDFSFEVLYGMSWGKRKDQNQLVD